ncbi:hypothetical protein ACS0TY_028893 [Phlomoides rotata]
MMGSMNEAKTPKFFTDFVFNWSIQDVMNTHLYKNKVNRIPETFTSVHHYLSSFTFPLIEETRADLRSKMMSLHAAPASEIISLEIGEGFKPPDNLLYLIELKRLADFDNTAERYEPEVGGLIALTEVRPKCIDDLNGPKLSYVVALVQRMRDEETNMIPIQCSKPIVFEEEDVELFAVHLTNLTTNMRIWNALRPCEQGHFDIIKNVLRINPSIDEDCSRCSEKIESSSNLVNTRECIMSLRLDGSQMDAVMNCVALSECDHRNDVKLIWGPPGTGKTKTIASLAFSLLKIKQRTLTCAPTNVAVVGVAKRLMSCLVGKLENDAYGLGDVVLFGNGKRMKIDDHDDLYDVFLDHRIEILAHCFAPIYGWRGSLDKMMCLLQNPKEQYQRYVKTLVVQNTEDNKDEKDMEVRCTFEEFFAKQVVSIAGQLKTLTVALYTHMPTLHLPLSVLRFLIRVLDCLQILESFLHKDISNERGLEKSLVGKDSLTLQQLIELLDAEDERRLKNQATRLYDIRLRSLLLLRYLKETFSVPEYKEKFEIRNFCLKNACLIFCTVSSSAKLLTGGSSPFKLVIIDEAGQVKECESSIPLQLPGLQHAILVGDEKQLPAMVQSEICEKADFGRSLFERLVRLGHRKQLLSVQYRMHPSISLFPNNMFYGNLIKNGPNVTASGYKKRFLKEQLYGPYSFINVTNGQEEFDNRHSRKNMMEVSIIAEIVSKLYKECNKSKKKVRIGCLSPYKAQVFAIQEALGKTYSSDANDAFSVNVRSVDGFQGGEEDIIIMSTVRCNGNGSVGFLEKHQRTNVALTRARYCMWILGNGATLLNSGSVWQKLVKDAKKRGCYYNAFEDKDLSLVIRNYVIEFGQLSSLLTADSVLFKVAKWKVYFCPKFHESISRVKDIEMKKEVVSVVEKLSNGFHEHHKDETRYLDGTYSQLLKCSAVKGPLRLVWTIDILSENRRDIQAIKVLDVLPQSQISELADEFELLFGNYTMNQMSRCVAKRTEGGLMIPMTWPVVANGRSMFSCSDLNANLSTQLAAVSLRDEPESHTRRVRRNSGRRRTGVRHRNS